MYKFSRYYTTVSRGRIKNYYKTRIQKIFIYNQKEPIWKLLWTTLSPVKSSTLQPWSYSKPIDQPFPLLLFVERLYNKQLIDHDQTFPYAYHY